MDFYQRQSLIDSIAEGNSHKWAMDKLRERLEAEYEPDEEDEG
jgi:hypothetical protein